ATGGLIAVPFLVVFGALFAAADAVFERSLRDLLELAWLRDLLRDAPARATIAVVVAWVTTGAFAQITWRASRGPARARIPGVLPSDAAFAALALIDALFAGFVVLQIAYLFGGRDTIDAAGVTYSAYGRRGFFELVAVNAIAPADFVARRNIERVLYPASLPADASRGLDVGYLVTLGEGAIPALFELAPELPAPERSAVLEVLRAATLRSETAVDWQS